MSHEAKNIKSCKINRKDNSRLGCRRSSGHIFAANLARSLDITPKGSGLSVSAQPLAKQNGTGTASSQGITPLQLSSRVGTLTRRACCCHFILDSTSPGSVCRHTDPLQTYCRHQDTCPLPHKQGFRYLGGITRGTHNSTPGDTFRQS